MEKITAASPEAQSADLVAGNIEQLKALFPELITEGPNGTAVNVDVLKALVGDHTVTDADEKYGLNWHGKRRARQLALTPSTGTLRPCPDESVDWDTTQNLMIEGDNLEVLKLLQKSYAGKVKLIYIDPPYNTGKDFVYPDNFQDNIKNYLELTGQVEGGQKISSNTEASGRFHTDWLNMIYPRLKLARNLLRDDGVLMVSVDDAEIDHMKSVCTDIFGEENMLAILIWNKQHSQQQGVFKRYHEYVIALARNASLIGNISGGEGEIDAGALKKISAANPASTFDFPAGVRFDATDGFELTGTYGDSEQVTVVSGRLVCKNGKTALPVTLSAGWTQKNQMTSWFSGQETYDTKDQKVVEFYFTGTGKLKCRKERSKITPPSLLPEYGMVSEQTSYLEQLMGAAVFQNPKPVNMIADFVSWFANSDDLVLDFFPVAEQRASLCSESIPRMAAAAAIFWFNSPNRWIRTIKTRKLPPISVTNSANPVQSPNSPKSACAAPPPRSKPTTRCLPAIPASASSSLTTPISVRGIRSQTTWKLRCSIIRITCSKAAARPMCSTNCCSSSASTCAYPSSSAPSRAVRCMPWVAAS